MFQSFFQHRYAAHKMFSMNRFWERFFYVVTYLCQGSSFLEPRSYAIIHRQHHAFSDTEKDPHSPRFFRTVISMMWQTKVRYYNYLHRLETAEAKFSANVPQWKFLDQFGDSWTSRFLWIGGYITFYVFFATQWWMYLLLPIHFVMGPVHGAIVNWCGHKYGYRNFKIDDESKNTLPFDFLTFGELFQNNHHRFGSRPSFAVRWFEIDPTYIFMRILNFLRIIKINPVPTAKD